MLKFAYFLYLLQKGKFVVFFETLSNMNGIVTLYFRFPKFFNIIFYCLSKTLHPNIPYRINRNTTSKKTFLSDKILIRSWSKQFGFIFLGTFCNKFHFIYIYIFLFWLFIRIENEQNFIYSSFPYLI